ncbi:VIPR1 isoform 10 [Pan troglodytes]|uniref:VIPR1 isoform 6 n=2 Tax=Hominidae TaxID=9604 RepID=A0A2J8WXT7_PONAB|nr:VIPR1 isoform 6 [Pan troglodytes]PNJ74589.1 VIPR1 isoform 6 [Pongo abelii]PNI81205.1 VIPR1 isoform 7 [Pan troglodytes]PNI81207.1 VIPR1 isoform 9 [Pan troglodytes]PNI81208.1 VIPR1 isoform 10 [Pan troglodytes]
MRPPSPLPARWLCVLAGALACALGPAAAARCGTTSPAGQPPLGAR